jgi:hypothetical protein
VAWGAAVVLALALCVRYDSSSEATVREEERLQSKAEVQANSLRRLALSLRLAVSSLAGSSPEPGWGPGPRALRSQSPRQARLTWQNRE